MTKKRQTKTITIDPRFFISPPYMGCPKCKKQEFGVLSIFPRRYTRRCRNCWHTRSYSLPSVKKKIIYIDQMVISEMMKLLNPKVEAKRKKRVKTIWRKLFEKLDSLVKLQLIICPDSSVHFRESLVIPAYFKALKRMYEQLSSGVSFYDEEVIKRFQISRNFKRWIGEKGAEKINIHNITHGGDLDAWQDRLRVSIDMRGDNQELIEMIRKEREQVDINIINIRRVFKRWQTEKDKKYDDWYEEERSAFGPMLVRTYFESLQRYTAAMDGKVKPTLGAIFPSSDSAIFTEIYDKLREKELSDEEVLMKGVEYFSSESIKNIPYLRISAALFAAIARKAAAGQKKPPSKGMVNDIKAIASLAPYCDAMFVDNECEGYLRENSVKLKTKLNTRFFSQKNIKDFLAYLQNIEESCSKKHLNKVSEVYGKGWGSPFIEMYNYGA